MNSLMISINPWSKTDVSTLCPVCKKEVTINDEYCYTCHLNLRTKAFIPEKENRELENKLKEICKHIVPV